MITVQREHSIYVNIIKKAEFNGSVMFVRIKPNIIMAILIISVVVIDLWKNQELKTKIFKLEIKLKRLQRDYSNTLLHIQKCNYYPFSDWLSGND